MVGQLDGQCLAAAVAVQFSGFPCAGGSCRAAVGPCPFHEEQRDENGVAFQRCTDDGQVHCATAAFPPWPLGNKPHAGPVPRDKSKYTLGKVLLLCYLT